MSKEIIGKIFEIKLNDGTPAVLGKVHSVEKMGNDFWANLGPPENTESTLWITECSSLREGSDGHACFTPQTQPEN